MPQAEQRLPWDYKDTGVAVAVTGPAFKFYVERQGEDLFTLISILAKAKVYARMSPDDKAVLVESL